MLGQYAGVGDLGEAILFTEDFHRAFRFGHLGLHTGQALCQPLGRLFGGIELGLQLVIDIDFWQFIGNPCCQHRVPRIKFYGQHIGPFDRIDTQF